LYTAYKFSGGSRTMVNLGSEEAITLARFKEFIWIWSTAI